MHDIPISMHEHKVNNAKLKEVIYGSTLMLHMLIDYENFNN